MTPKEWARECLRRIDLAGAEASASEVVEVIVTRAIEEALGAKKRQFTGLLDNCCLKIFEGDLIRVGMRRGDINGWSSVLERVVWLTDDREWGLADSKTGEKMGMQWDQELRAKVTTNQGA